MGDNRIYDFRVFFREFVVSTTGLGIVLGAAYSIYYRNKTTNSRAPEYIGVEDVTAQSTVMNKGRAKYQMGVRSGVINHWLYYYAFKAELSSGETIWVNTPSVVGVQKNVPVKVKVYRCYRFEGCKIYQHIVDQQDKRGRGRRYYRSF